MKKICLTLAALAALHFSAQATLVLSDNFTYPDGPIISAPGTIWSPHSGSGSMMVTNKQLVVSRSRGEDVNAPLAGAPYLASDPNATLYSSFTIVISNDMPTVAGTYFAHFRGTNTGASADFGARVFVSMSNTVSYAPVPAGKYRVSIANGAAGTDNNLLGQIDQDLSTNTVYTIVTRFVPSTGLATIWLNPTSEADPGATATDPGTTAAPNPFNVFTYAFRQNGGEGTIWVDNLKIGTAFNDVAGTNTAPTISAFPNQSIAANSSTAPLNFTVNDAETDATSLVVTAASSNTNLVPNAAANLALGGSGAARTLTVTPTANQQGATTITLSVSDGVNTSFTTFTLTVGAPSVSAIANRIALVNATIPGIPFTVFDAESDTLTPSVNSSNPTLLKNSNITVSGTGNNRTVTLVPEANQTGVTTVTLSFTDGHTTSSSSFVLTVSPNLGVLLQDQFAYTAWNFVPQSLYDAVGTIWSTVSGTAYQVQVTNGWCYLAATNSEDVAASLASGPFASTSGLVVYSSFTLRCTQLPTYSGNYFAHLKDAVSGTTFRAKLFAATNGATAGHYRIGVANSANTGTYFPLDCSPDTDYVVVTRYNSGTGESVLWVNPYMESSPSLAATDSAQTAQVGAFGLREDTSNGTSGNLQISNLVVSTSFPSLPQPPTPPSITGISVTGGTVTIDFTAGTGDSASNFQVFSAAVVDGTYAAAAGATISALGGGNFRATVPTSGSQQFYRVKR